MFLGDPQILGNLPIKKHGPSVGTSVGRGQLTSPASGECSLEQNSVPIYGIDLQDERIQRGACRERPLCACYYTVGKGKVGR